MRTVPHMMTIAELLAVAHQLPRHALACTTPLLPLALNDPCLVIDSRDLDETEDVSSQAVELGLTLAIGRRAVQDVLNNLALQRSSSTPEQSLDALNYFVVAGAYIDLHPDRRREDCIYPED